MTEVQTLYSEASATEELKTKLGSIKTKLEKSLNTGKKDEVILDPVPKKIEIGSKVRHTRFLNTNSKAGTYVLEILENKALCKYVDSLGRNKEVWFVLNDLIRVK